MGELGSPIVFLAIVNCDHWSHCAAGR